MVTKIKQPKKRGGDAIGRALGVGQVVAGAFTANPLLVTSGLGAAAGKDSEQGQALSKISGLGSTVGGLAGAVNSDSSKPNTDPVPDTKPSPGTKAGVKAGSSVSQDVAPSAMERKLMNDPNLKNASSKDHLAVLKDGEDALNEIRKVDPDLANELQGPLFEGIFEASNRMKRFGSLTGGAV